MKKVLAVALTLVMLLGLLPMAALAADWSEPTISISATELDANDIVAVTVAIDLAAGSKAVASYGLAVEYNSDVFQPTNTAEDCYYDEDEDETYSFSFDGLRAMPSVINENRSGAASGTKIFLLSAANEKGVTKPKNATPSMSITIYFKKIGEAASADFVLSNQSVGGSPMFEVTNVDGDQAVYPATNNSVTVTLGGGETPKTQVTAPTAITGTYTYDGTEQTAAFDVAVDESIVTVTNGKQTNAGTYTVSFALKDTENYEWAAAPANLTWTIAPKVVTFAIDDIADQIETGAAIEPVVTVKDGETTLTKDTDYTVTYGSNVAVGTATVTVTGAGNYAGSTGSKTFNIVAAPIEKTQVTAPAAITGTYTYDGTEQTAAFDVAVDESIVTVTNGKQTNAGTYTVSFALKDTENYEWAAAPANLTWTIARAAATVTATNMSKTVGDPEPTFTATVAGTYGSDTLTYNVEREGGEAAGTYVINVTGAAVQGNYDVTYVPGTFTITEVPKTPVTKPTGVTATYTYDGTEQTVTVDGFDAATMVFGGDTAKTDAGSYTVTVALKDSATTKWADDSSDALSFAWTIARAAATVTADDMGKNVGEAEPTFTATVTGTYGSDTLTYNVERVAGEAAGTYAINVTGAAVQGNYDVTYVPGTFTITEVPKTPVTKPTGVTTSYTYDGTEQTVTVDGFDAATMVLSGDTAKTDAGNYTVTVALKDPTTTKWADDSSDALSFPWTIAPKAATLTIDAIADQTYTGAAIEPTVTVKDGATTLAAADYDVVYGANTAVGTATVTVTAKGNYTGTANASFNITAKAITFTVGAIPAQIYTGSALEPAVSVYDGTTLLVKDADYTVAYASNTDKGTATVTVTGIGNYAGSTGSATFEITDVPPYVPPVNPTYAITVEEAENGTVTVSAKTAAEGATVTVTAKADELYELDAISVTDKAGNEIAVTDGTFKMPASSVKVSATFKKIAVAFKDVADSDYFADAVLWAVANKVTDGKTDELFAPADVCTRAEAVTFLYRAFGSVPVTGEMKFTDVDADAYYYDAVLWAANNAITDGVSEDLFAPNATVTRGEIVTFLYRAAKAAKADVENPFTDVDADAFYADAVLWAVANGITDGTSATTFSPASVCTRAEIVTFLYRYCK